MELVPYHPVFYTGGVETVPIGGTRMKPLGVKAFLRYVYRKIRPVRYREDWREMYKRCPCGKVVMKKDYEDHLQSHRPDPADSEQGLTQQTSSTDQQVSRGDLVDDYDTPEWAEPDEDDGIVLQEPTGQQMNAKRRRVLRTRNYVNTVIGKFGRYVIRRQTHVGGVRGGHILQEFKQGVRRHPADALENYRIKNDGTGDYPIVIEPAE